MTEQCPKCKSRNVTKLPETVTNMFWKGALGQARQVAPRTDEYVCNEEHCGRRFQRPRG